MLGKRRPAFRKISVIFWIVFLLFAIKSGRFKKGVSAELYIVVNVARFNVGQLLRNRK
jgi:hypothetical protein